MILENSTWLEVSRLSRQQVVLIPTGSLEQHGHHLPLLTDTLISRSVAEAVERNLPEQVILVPAVWLGASSHHMGFPGTLTATFETYGLQIQNVVESMVHHGFRKFMIVNGHGGNTGPNDVVTRLLLDRNETIEIGHVDYYQFLEAELADVLTGPRKQMGHGCEAETSLMLHLFPDLVRMPLARNDGLSPEPAIVGMVHPFQVLTEEGSLGYATLGTAEKGRRLFEDAVAAVTQNVRILAEGYIYRGME